MDHGHMHHGGDMGDMEPMCQMSMLFTWDPTDLCIIFKSWHIRSTFSLLWSLVAVAALTAGYEAVRELSRRYESSSKQEIDALPNSTEASSLLYPGRTKTDAERKSKVIKAAFYAVQVFYSFFIMLLFMTYNGWVMLAVAVGAFIGYLAFGQGSAQKTVACH